MSTIYVSSGQVYSGYDDGDSIVVQNGGFAEDYTVAGGDITFNSGAQGSGGLLLGSAEEIVEIGATVSETTVNAASVYEATQVISGGEAVDTLVIKGVQEVSSGIVVSAQLIPVSVGATDYADQGSFPIQYIGDQGVALDTVMSAQAFQPTQQDVNSGGLADHTMLTGYGFWTSNLLSSNPPSVYLIEYANQTVQSGGTSENSEINQYGGETIAAGGIMSGVTTINGGQLSLYSPQGDGSVAFTGLGGVLIIYDDEFNNAISDFAPTDEIDISVPYSTVTGYAETSNTLTLETTTGDITLDISRTDAQDNYTLSTFASFGTAITLCYMRGTRILTPTGTALVEELRIGDLVVTRWSGIQAIKWIGWQSYDGRFLRNNPNKAPVRIEANALGDRLPAKDLWVSPDHSMLIGQQLVLAANLANGVTITQNIIPDEVHYYQLELAAHECILAEGTWSETYADGDGLRNQFHNVAEFYTLYPDHREPDELILCAPRPERGPKLAAALTPVVARATERVTVGPLIGCIDLIPTAWKVEGWAFDSANPDLPVMLEVLIEDQVIGLTLACDHRSDLEQAGYGRGQCAFQFLSEVKMRPEEMHAIRVRRVADGAEIRMSAACHERIDETFFGRSSRRLTG